MIKISKNRIKINWHVGIDFVLPNFKKHRKRFKHKLLELKQSAQELKEGLAPLFSCTRIAQPLRQLAERVHECAHTNFLNFAARLRKRGLSRLEKGIAIFTAVALIIQVALFGVFGSLTPSGHSDELCSIAVDTVLVMDTSGSMDDGGAPSKCEWENLEWVTNTYMCVYHQQSGLTEQQCQTKDDGRPQCPFGPVYTPAVPSKISAAKTAAKLFVDNLKSNDQSALVSFNTTVSLNKTLSNEHAATKTAIDGLATGGSTNIGDAIALGTGELSSVRSNPKANKVMILLTDGKANKPNGYGYDEDPRDVAYAQTKAQEAAALGYKIFTIGLGSGSEINEAMLQSIALATAAKYYHAPTSNDLEDIYNQIAYEVCQYGSISGCKYSDANNDGSITGEQPLAGWEVILAGLPGNATTSRLTDSSGCYTFAGLVEGNYTISEGANADKQPFSQTYPADGFYNLTLSKGQNVVDIDFGNYLPVCGNSILDASEQCDDGNSENGDGCSSTCQVEETPTPSPSETPSPTPSETPSPTPSPTPSETPSPTPTETPSPTPSETPSPSPSETPSPSPSPSETPSPSPSETPTPTPSETPTPTPTPSQTPSPTPSPSVVIIAGSSGSTSFVPDLIILDESLKTTDISTTSVTILWTTDKLSTSQVIYSAEGQPHTLDLLDRISTPPKYGYANTTPEYDLDPKVADHGVTIFGLNPNTAYYFRAVSHGSLVFSQQSDFKTLALAGQGGAGNEEIAQSAATGLQIESPSSPSPTPSPTPSVGTGTTKKPVETVKPASPSPVNEPEFSETTQEVFESQPPEPTQENLADTVSQNEHGFFGNLFAAIGSIGWLGLIIALVIALIALLILWFLRRRQKEDNFNQLNY